MAAIRPPRPRKRGKKPPVIGSAWSQSPRGRTATSSTSQTPRKFQHKNLLPIKKRRPARAGRKPKPLLGPPSARQRDSATDRSQEA